MSHGPRKPRGEPTDQVDEAPGLIDQDQVDIEREQSLGQDEPIEGAPDKPSESPSDSE